MAKDPAVLLYTGDLLNGMMDMDMEERGQYITMLCAQHQKGHLSEKTIRLLVGSVSVSVMDKFLQDENGNFYNERMKIEIDKRRSFLDSRKDNGKKGGRPKKPSGKPYAKPRQNLRENENEDVFNIFYKEYPLKKNKAAAIKAWGKLKPEEQQLAITAVKTFQFNPDSNFIPHPASWLNGRRWEDEQAQPQSKHNLL